MISFNPQELVCQRNEQESAETGRQLATTTVQAIYVSTRSRPDHLHELLLEISGIGPSQFILPSDTTQDVPEMSHEIAESVEILDFRDSIVPLALQRYLSFSHPVFSVDQCEWDLPTKRNFALWHAARNRFRHILLLDDDIRGLAPEFLCRAGEALTSHSIVGGFVTQFPDTSVVGHIERTVGVDVYPFMSGSCLFIDVNSVTGMFPAIYNEDWVFMAPEIERRRVCSIGCVHQAAADPFDNASLASFQEPGELIADSIFTMLGAGMYGKRFRVATWAECLSERLKWLEQLQHRVAADTYKTALTSAVVRLKGITPQDCVDYMEALEHDREMWKRLMDGSV